MPFWTRDGGAAKAPASDRAPAAVSAAPFAPGRSCPSSRSRRSASRKAGILGRQLREELTDAMARFDGINVVADLKSSDGSSDWSEYRLSGRAEYGADGAMSFSFRLVDAADGTVVWSRVFPNLQEAANPDAARDSIVREVASTIAEPFGILWTRELSDHSDRDPRRTCLVETVEYWRRFDIVRHERVRQCLSRMVADYPSYAPAYSGLALVYLRDFERPSRSIAHAITTSNLRRPASLSRASRPGR